MKNLTLLFLTVGVILFASVPLVFSQNISKSDAVEIRKAITDFLTCVTKSDYAGALNYISPSFHGKQGGYNAFKTELKELLEAYERKYTNYENAGFQISQMTIKSNTAILELEYTIKWFNLKKGMDESIAVRRHAELLKEAAGWKITKYEQAEKVISQESVPAVDRQQLKNQQKNPERKAIVPVPRQ